MTLRQHVKDHHKRLPLRRSNKALAHEHGHDHLHYGWTKDHYHGEAEMRNRGSGLVPGWLTGEDVVMKVRRT